MDQTDGHAALGAQTHDDHAEAVIELVDVGHAPRQQRRLHVHAHRAGRVRHVEVAGEGQLRLVELLVQLRVLQHEDVVLLGGEQSPNEVLLLDQIVNVQVGHAQTVAVGVALVERTQIHLVVVGHALRAAEPLIVGMLQVGLQRPRALLVRVRHGAALRALQVRRLAAHLLLACVAAQLERRILRENRRHAVNVQGGGHVDQSAQNVANWNARLSGAAALGLDGV